MRRLSRAAQKMLYVETEVHHITVAHDVLLAFQTDKPLVTRRSHAAKRYEIIIVHDLGTDEAALEVRMDLPCRLRCRRPARNRPCTTFILTRREEGLKP